MTKRTIILLSFVVVKFVVQYLLIDSEYQLHRDEYLHLDQGNHLAWGYISVPPLTSWISFIIKLLGNSVFWVKFFPALFGALTIVAVWKTIEELGGNLFSLVLGATCILLSVLLRLNILYQPNAFDVLAWTVLYFILIRYFNTENFKWLFIAAIVFALGFLNKYNIGFLVLGLVPALLLTPQRKIFLRKELYWSILIALVLVLPNILWQVNNDFPVIHHLKELADTQLVNVDRFSFLKNQLLFFLGAFFVIVAALYALVVYKPFKNFSFFFWNFFTMLSVFMYFKAKDYYAIGLYPVYIAFGSVYLEKILQTGWWKYLQIAAIVLPVLVFIPIARIAFPNKSPEYILQHPEYYKKLGLLRWEDGKDHTLPQDFADMLGWKELAQKVDSVFSKMPDTKHTLVLCDNYGQTGAINYYKTNPKLVANSLNADYINWLPYDQEISDVILVKENKYDRDKERKREAGFFDSVYLAAKRVHAFAREDTISIYILKGAKVDIGKLLREEANNKKKSR